VSGPEVSVLLLVRDAMPQLPELLDRLAKQRIDARVEIVAVDSGSRDGSRELLAAKADRLISIDPAHFRHGLTRNLGVEACRGERVALLVQDALPASERWLAELVAPLAADERAAGSFSRQLPTPGARALARRQLAGWVASRSEARRVCLDAASYERLAPLERLEACAFDNVSACVRRGVWRRHPFPDVPIAEDLAWGREVLLAGHALCYAPLSVVVHSHDRSLRYELERTAALHEQLGRLFGVETVGSLPALAHALGASLPHHVRCLAEDAASAGTPPSEWLRVLGLAAVWPAAQYLGALRARRRARGAPR
jgi:rhamnosyltransferase